MQRVLSARVEVLGEVTGRIEQGLVAFVGAEIGDTESDATYVINKITSLRVFEDERGKMARSLIDIEGSLLFVTQFTLFGDVRKGNRPSFTGAMAPAEAKELLEKTAKMAAAQVEVQTGRFGADMRVFVENDGPVTILLDSRTR